MEEDVARVGEETNAYRILIGKPVGKRPHEIIVLCINVRILKWILKK